MCSKRNVILQLRNSIKCSSKKSITILEILLMLLEVVDKKGYKINIVKPMKVVIKQHGSPK